MTSAHVARATIDAPRRIGRRGLLTGGFAGAFPLVAAGCALPLPARPAVRTGADAPASAPAGMTAPTGAPADDFVRGLPPEAPPPAWDARTPADILTAVDVGRTSQLANGQTLREFTVIAREADLEVAPGVTYRAWTYNGTVPGPTLRCTEGDRVRVYFLNATGYPHNVHFHGVHPAEMDGVAEELPPGRSFVYEFDAEPFGLYPYHCHAMPGKKHIEKGLYGTLIVDPKSPRPPAVEMTMVMNGFDTDADGKNDFYTVNGVANYFAEHPIPLRVGVPVRIYVVNMTEFDPVNSFHLHGNMFKLYRSGTSLSQYELTDTVTLGQGERAVLELVYKHRGKYMFHAHQSEFSELGWTGFFDVQP